ncbi:MAG: hypothetical protein ABI540_09445 [Spartobacteria bacterium]
MVNKANKEKKAKAKKAPAKVQDLTASKDPKGGAQKKEGPGQAGSVRGGGTPLKPVKNRLS